MKCPQTKFHANTMSNCKALGKKSQNFLEAEFFSLSTFY